MNKDERRRAVAITALTGAFLIAIWENLPDFAYKLYFHYLLLTITGASFVYVMSVVFMQVEEDKKDPEKAEQIAKGEKIGAHILFAATLIFLTYSFYFGTTEHQNDFFDSLSTTNKVAMYFTMLGSFALLIYRPHMNLIKDAQQRAQPTKFIYKVYEIGVPVLFVFLCISLVTIIEFC
jgi:Cu/Ag efflux pump CusA